MDCTIEFTYSTDDNNSNDNKDIINFDDVDNIDIPTKCLINTAVTNSVIATNIIFKKIKS